MKSQFTSESVTPGHPDKVCDQISDAVLDAYLVQDKNSRVACEVAASAGKLLIFGEVKSKGTVDVESVARNVLNQIGYGDPELQYFASEIPIEVGIIEQSPEISEGVDGGNLLGAGDQGMMFGYAVRETQELMPLAGQLSHWLSEKLTQVRKSLEVPDLRPDGKTQVTLEYDGLTPVAINTIVISTQHAPRLSLPALEDVLWRHVINPVLEERSIGLPVEDQRVLINPAGTFHVGGPAADSGLTGRKIIVDTYGGAARHGGGAFSGKDSSKVDRSAAYALRQVAKTIVKAGLADKAEVQVAYAIGYPAPVSLRVETFGTGQVTPERLSKAVLEVFDLTPAGIIRDLELQKPIFQRTATFGHFGREYPEFKWETVDHLVPLLWDALAK